jgi:hypothetical protein
LVPFLGRIAAAWMLTSPDEHGLALEVGLLQITDTLLRCIHDDAAAASDAHLGWLGTSQTSLALNTHGHCHFGADCECQTQYNRLKGKESGGIASLVYRALTPLNPYLGSS